jgi:hypothetical protein
MVAMYQSAPFPDDLDDLVSALKYKPGWRFHLADIDRGQGSRGLTLVIDVRTVDSYHPERELHVNHYMLVPPAAYDVRSWRRWLLDQILLVEQHEACEFFAFEVESERSSETARLVRPYAPSHGPGNDPYLIREIGTDEDRRTSFRGELPSP